MNKMKNIRRIFLMLLCYSSFSLTAQQSVAKVFEPAKAYKQNYSALYILNEAEDKKIKAMLKSINNVLEDSRLKGRLHIEIIAFAEGVEMYKKANHYKELLIALKDKGVVFLQCAKTMEERKIAKEDLFDFVNYVPTGNGEIILRKDEGWAIVHL